MDDSKGNDPSLPRSGPRVLAASVVLLLASLRLAHINVLWTDEDYHLAAAIQIMHGRLPYRDFLYDKPPVSAFFYALIGGHSGWPLRFLDVCYVLVACTLAYSLARKLWTEREGFCAAVLLAFFLAFYLPPAVVSFAPDALLLVPQLAAIYAVQTRRYSLAGVMVAIGFLINTKAVFVFAACALFVLLDSELEVRQRMRGLLKTMLSAAAILLAAYAAASYAGAWPGYVEQVVRWGVAYAKGSPVAHPFREAALRTLNWAGFHAALVAGTAWMLCSSRATSRVKIAGWLLFSYAGVALGSRFAPRYFLQILPVLVTAAAWGWSNVSIRFRWCAAVAGTVMLLIPSIRFGPRYAMLAADNLRGRSPAWADLAMDTDSQAVANKLQNTAKPGDSLFVWGCRSDIYVYTRMLPDSRFWNSEPITGVPADRHLFSVVPVETQMAHRYRLELAQTHPVYLVDGLGVLNPRLAPSRYPELQDWIAQYDVVDRTAMSLIYKRRQ